jgi:hypothetical protein
LASAFIVRRRSAARIVGADTPDGNIFPPAS